MSSVFLVVEVRQSSFGIACIFFLFFKFHFVWAVIRILTAAMLLTSRVFIVLFFCYVFILCIGIARI